MSTKIPRGPIGFRLANELEGILHGIRADYRITPDEQRRVERWLAANESFRDVRPFSELAIHLENALADGELSMDECDDLLFLTAKYTVANPYFDALRSGIQVLMGMLTGIAADNVVTETEAQELMYWSETWSHLAGLWPYDECCGIVTRLLARQRLQEDARYLQALATQFPVAGHTDGAPPPPPLVTGVCAVEPKITFPGRCFVMTGESQRADREAISQRVRSTGAEFADSVTKETDYLVVCDNGCPHWAFSCYGRKVEKAYKMRQNGHHVLLVQEDDFWEAMTDQHGVGYA